MHPILFKIGPLTLRTYGLIVAFAFFITFFLLYKEAKRRNFHADQILDLELLILVAGIIGARALHVLVNLAFYRENPADIFFIWRGGLAFYGGLILAFLLVLIFLIKKKMPLLETGDLIAPYLALGQSIGRIGCYLNGCCYGKEVSFVFLGVVFPGEYIYRYPTQLYASLALLCIFIMLRFTQDRPHFGGFVMGLYLLLYSSQRFLVDFLRADTPRYANLTVSQMISIAIFVLTLLILQRLRGQRRGQVLSRH